jgi:hypothetical protein
MQAPLADIKPGVWITSQDKKQSTIDVSVRAWCLEIFTLANADTEIQFLLSPHIYKSKHLHIYKRKCTMKTRLLIAVAALTCAFSGFTFAMTKVEYTAQIDTINSDYTVSREKCNSLNANAKDICVSEAKGIEKIAKAELKAAYEPSARHTEKVAMAKGDAAYDTAKEKCDDSAGNAKTICKKDAKAAHVKASDEARVVRVSAETGKLNAGVRNMATKDENEASYKAAASRCDGMVGAAKDSCVADAKSKFGMK